MAVERGDLDGLAEAQRRELVAELRARRIVELVRDEQHGLTRSPQDVGQLGVARRQAGAGVDEKYHEVGLLDRRPGLGDCAASNHGLVRDVDAARVHEQEALARPLAEELLAVARHARRLVDDGGAGRGQPVDERRLADVRIADDGHGALQLVHAPSMSAKRPDRHNAPYGMVREPSSRAYRIPVFAQQTAAKPPPPVTPL